ncbi:accessory gene regulator B family protein [Ignavigranum ruoffiae]|uniref:accessory gene regulator B family protein n=1 Tax=Ignavigranum ruoffiae TaxID=89093 RepID=UPI0020606DEB|nr:accessory gene regulator B family protein [Ignavigranum ruoffiae]UPQ86122.1 accessory gene regulator B family protein [Ignavigranum ruoffiae]
MDYLSWEERLADQLVAYLYRRSSINLSSEDYELCLLGAEILMINFIKIGMIYISAYLVGVFVESLMVHILFYLWRKTRSNPYHAEKGYMCTLINLSIFVALPWSIKYLILR